MHTLKGGGFMIFQISFTEAIISTVVVNFFSNVLLLPKSVRRGVSLVTGVTIGIILNVTF